jgi:hypothetical protein
MKVRELQTACIIEIGLVDNRTSGSPIDVKFLETLHNEQIAAVAPSLPKSALSFRRVGSLVTIQQHSIDLHGAVNILESVLADVLKGDGEPAETPLRVFLYSARHADPADFRERLQSCCHVYPITMMLVPSTISPTLTPILNSIRLSGGICAFRWTIARWISTAQRKASTALTNMTNKPSPDDLRPMYLDDVS